MHIAIDTTPLHTAHQMRGIGSYTRFLISALQKYESKHSYTFFVRGEKVPKNADVIHIPYFDPFFATLPVFHSKPTVVTVHDLIPIVFPDHFPAGIKGSLKWYIQRFALLQVAGIITDSNASKHDIERLTHISPTKIYVVPLAADDQYKRVTNVEELTRVQKQHHLPGVFVLYVGDINWNKNMAGLLAGFGRYWKPGKATLVLVGKAFLDLQIPQAREIDSLIYDLHLEHAVIRTGYVDAKDLPAIYSLAHTYIQPSIAEGFGLPVLEAMACGTPTICSGLSSLGEIAGPSLTIDPDRPETMVGALETVFSMKNSEYKKWSRISATWAQEFSWKKTAHETLRVYEQILANL